jgi:hypothetical protein
MKKDKRDLRVIELYKKGVKKAEISRIVGLSRERIGQIIKQALDKSCECDRITSEEWVDETNICLKD